MLQKIKQFFSRDRKSNVVQSGQTVFLDSFTQNLIYSNEYRTLAKNGYMQNVIAYHCIDKIATSAQNIPVELLINGEPVDQTTRDRLASSLLKNLKQPNTDVNGKQFIHNILAYRMIGGEYYVWTEKSNTGVLLDSQYLRPDRITKNTNGNERITSFMYTRGSETKVFKRDDDLNFDIMYHFCFNPLNDIEGLSPLSAGGMSLNQYNSANTWNKGLFDNGSKLSGVLTLNPDTGDSFSAIDEDDVTSVADDLNRKFKSRLGGVAVVNAPGTFTPMALNPTEMDFLNGQKMKALEICNALNYPPYLLGIEGATFNNQREAKESLYEEAVIPILNEFYEEYSMYHTRLFDTNIEYRLDLSNVTALAEKRERQSQSARDNYQSGLITLNEARASIGKEAVDFGDEIFSTTLPTVFNDEGNMN